MLKLYISNGEDNTNVLAFGYLLTVISRDYSALTNADTVHWTNWCMMKKGAPIGVSQKDW